MGILRLLAMGLVIFLLTVVLVYAGIFFTSPEMSTDLAFSIIFYSATGVTVVAVFFLRRMKLFGGRGGH